MNETQVTRIINVRNFTYEAALAASEKIGWRIEDLVGNGKKMDFNRPFMPEALARVEPFKFLTPREQLTLNQIRGHTYLCIFGLVEEFILPFVMDHARSQLGRNGYRDRALLQFANEEAKHIQLFKRFREEFERDFGRTCNIIGPPVAVAQKVLSHHPLGVALVILHIEWMTQAHYVESVKDNVGLDPMFRSLLRHHWLEESQHAKLDTLMVESLAEGYNDTEINLGIEDYLQIGMFIDGGLKQQVEFDLEAFESATGRRLTAGERLQMTEVQLQANRYTYLGSGMSHPNFQQTLELLQPGARKRIQEIAPMFH